MDPDLEKSLDLKSAVNCNEKYPSMVPALTSSELAILSRPSSPLPPKIRPKIKERPTLFCFDRIDFEKVRPKTAKSSKNPNLNKPQRTSRLRNRISITRNRNNLTSPKPAPTAAHIFKRRSRSLQSPSVSKEKLDNSFENPECEVFEGQAVFRSRHCLKPKLEPSMDSEVGSITAENDETEDFCRMEELVNYLANDQETILKELSHGIDVSTDFDPMNMTHASVQTATRTVDNCTEQTTETTLQRIERLEETNRFCTTEIQTLRNELSEARRIIAEKSQKLEKLNPNEGPPWVVPSEENAFRPAVDYFSFRTIDEPTCVAKVRSYQPGMSIKRASSPPKQKNQIPPRGNSAPADKSYLGLHHRKLRYESCTDAKTVTSKPPVSPASRTRSLPGTPNTSVNPSNNSPSNFMKPQSNGHRPENKSNVEYLAIALASREGLLREIAYSIKKAKKILHFRFNMLLASEFSMQDLHFLLTSHRRFLRWLNNYIHYSMSLVERFDSKYVKTHNFYVPAIMDGDHGDVLKGIFIPVPGKGMCDKKPVNTLKRSSVETQTYRPGLVCSYAQCQSGSWKDFSHQADTKVSEPKVNACVQTYSPLTDEKSTMAFASANDISLPSVAKVMSCRNVALEQLLKNSMESQESMDLQATVLRHQLLHPQDSQIEIRACAKQSGNKICAANFGISDTRKKVHHNELEVSDNANSSETPSSEPFVDCSSKESDQSMVTQESSASTHHTECYGISNCKGDYYDPLPSGTNLLTPEDPHLFAAIPSGPLQSSTAEIFSPLDLIMDSHLEEAEQFYNHKGNADFRAVDLSDFVLLHDDGHIENQVDSKFGTPSPARKFETVEDYAEFFDETVANFKRKQTERHDLPKFKSAAQVVLDILHDRHESMLLKQRGSSNSSKTPSTPGTGIHNLIESDLDMELRTSGSTAIYYPVDSELEDGLPMPVSTVVNVDHECQKAISSRNQCSTSVEKRVIKSPEVPLSSPRSRLPVPLGSVKHSPRPKYLKPVLGHGSNDSTAGNLTEESHYSTPKSSMTSRVTKVRDKVKKSFIPVKKTNNEPKKVEAGENHKTAVHQVAVPRVHKCRNTNLQGNSGQPYAGSTAVSTNLKVLPSVKKTAETISKRNSLTKMLNFSGRKWNQSKANSNL